MAKMKKSTACDVARAIPTLRERLKHYRVCTDARCVKRQEAWEALKTEFQKQQAKGNGQCE